MVRVHPGCDHEEGDEDRERPEAVPAPLSHDHHNNECHLKQLNDTDVSPDAEAAERTLDDREQCDWERGCVELHFGERLLAGRESVGLAEPDGVVPLYPGDEFRGEA